MDKSKSPSMCTWNLNKQTSIAGIPVLSLNTRHFIRKICNQEAVSIDMTKYGFVMDSKLQPISLMLKPLRDQLIKIIDGNDKKPTMTLQSIIKRSSTKRDKKYGVCFRDEKGRPTLAPGLNVNTDRHATNENLSRPRKTKKNPKSRIQRAKANKSSRNIAFV